jgi:hypothetical protein
VISAANFAQNLNPGSERSPNNPKLNRKHTQATLKEQKTIKKEHDAKLYLISEDMPVDEKHPRDMTLKDHICGFVRM